MRSVLFNSTLAIFFASILSISVSGSAQVKDVATRAAMVPTAETIKYNVAEIETIARLAQPVRSVAVQPNTATRTGSAESRHSTYGTLAATLVLMIAIAIRRYRSGRS